MLFVAVGLRSLHVAIAVLFGLVMAPAAPRRHAQVQHRLALPFHAALATAAAIERADDAVIVARRARPLRREGTRLRHATRGVAAGRRNTVVGRLALDRPGEDDESTAASG